jgi:enolase
MIGMAGIANASLIKLNRIGTVSETINAIRTLKSGAPARGGRVAKYNRLMVIASAFPELPYGLPDNVKH